MKWFHYKVASYRWLAELNLLLLFLLDEDTDVMAEEEVDPLSEEYSPDDSLPPLRRILTYYKNENNDNR